MSQPDTLCESLRNFGMLVGMKQRQTNDPLLFNVGEIMQHAEREIRRLGAEAVTLQAQATTYWDVLTDILPIAERETRAKQWHDHDGTILLADRTAIDKARAALAKPTT